MILQFKKKKMKFSEIKEIFNCLKEFLLFFAFKSQISYPFKNAKFLLIKKSN